MSDDFEKYYENKEANEDSKSDAKVITFFNYSASYSRNILGCKSINYCAPILIAESNLIVSPLR